MPISLSCSQISRLDGLCPLSFDPTGCSGFLLLAALQPTFHATWSPSFHRPPWLVSVINALLDAIDTSPLSVLVDFGVSCSLFSPSFQSPSSTVLATICPNGERSPVMPAETPGFDTQMLSSLPEGGTGSQTKFQ